jgi:hypothetical protein
MSLEATWDLGVPSAPRSFWVYTSASSSDPNISSNFGNAPHPPSSASSMNSSSRNPFEVAASITESPSASTGAIPSNSNDIVTAMLVGTERGTLHFRAFAPNQNKGIITNKKQAQPAMGMSNSSSGAISSAAQTAIPRQCYPVDFAGLAGPIVSVVSVATAVSSQQHQLLLLVLVDDHRGTSAAQPGVFAAHWMTWQPSTPQGKSASGRFGILSPPGQQALPRMSCAVYHPHCGLVYAAGRKLGHVAIPTFTTNSTDSKRSRQSQQQSQQMAPKIQFGHAILPAPGARSGPDAMAINQSGTVVVVAVGNSFTAITGIPTINLMNHPATTAMMMAGDDTAPNTSNLISSSVNNNSAMSTTTKLISFAQASQVHPVLCLDVLDPSVEPDWTCWFLASSRACAVVDFYNPSSSSPSASHHYAASHKNHSPRGSEIVTLASPILAAATCWPWLVVLTSDGLLSVRSPSCLAIALKTVEVGTRPNDYFALQTLSSSSSSQRQQHQRPGQQSRYNSSNSNMNMLKAWVVATSYAAQAKVLQCQPDTTQELADRLMRLAIDALGANGFPRAYLAEAVHASFTATSYVGPEPTPHARYLLQQYLEAVLGLMDLESGACTSWPTTATQQQGDNPSQQQQRQAAHHHGAFGDAQQRQRYRGSGGSQTGGRNKKNPSYWKEVLPCVVSAASPPSLLTCTALLCLVCGQVQPIQASLANRAAKACVQQLGMIVTPQEVSCDGAVQVCTSVAETLLQTSSQQGGATAAGGGGGEQEFSLIAGSSPKPIMASSARAVPMEFVEAAVWLLRSCGHHERAMQVLYERLQQQQQGGDSKTGTMSSSNSTWSQIKYDSYTATHLSELWGSGREEGCSLVLTADATRRLLEHNPRLGLSAFTALHPQNLAQWKQLKAKDDPLLAHPTHPRQVLQLLDSIQPVVPYQSFAGAGTGSATARSGRLGGSEEDVTPKSTVEDEDDDGYGHCPNKKGSINDDDNSDVMLPLESGRALAVTFLESALGIATGRPTEEDEFDSLPMEASSLERMADFQDELAFFTFGRNHCGTRG